MFLTPALLANSTRELPAASLLVNFAPVTEPVKSTSSFLSGLVVPMPTLPEVSMQRAVPALSKLVPYAI